MDRISSAQRSRIMQAVGKRNTAPELRVRGLLHPLGYRYRLHVKALPGNPDIVFPGRKKALFIHGCFWHGHECRASLRPQSRQDYWLPKIERNRVRDSAAMEALSELGWRCAVVWECETARVDKLRRRLLRFLGPPRLHPK